jgi:hypothetical protein
VDPHAEAAGVVVYLATSHDDIVRVDLGTGTVQRRTGFDAAKPHRGTWRPLGRKGGYVVSSPSDQRSRSILGVSDDPASTPAVLDGPSDGSVVAGTQVAPAAEPDEVWLWNQRLDSPAPVALRRVRIDGVVTAGPVTLPFNVVVLGADGPGAVALSGPGGMYRAVVTGTAADIGPVWPWPPVAYNDRSVLDMTCTGSLDCGLEVVDRASQQSRPVSLKPEDLARSGVLGSLLSPNGAWLAHVDAPDEATMRVYDLLGNGTPISHRIMPPVYSQGPVFGDLRLQPNFGFSPDGQWLIFLDQSDAVELWPVGRPQPPLTVTVPGLHGLTALSVAPA